MHLFSFIILCYTVLALKNGGIRMKTGLVIEGGGVRGIYAAGVLDQLMEMGISFDGVIGVSAGAIHGCSYLSGQKGRSIRYYKKYCSDPRFMGFRSWLKTGDIVGADFCYRELPDKLDVYNHAAFLRNQTPFYVVCSNVDTGKAEYIRLTDMQSQIDYLRASASLPYFSRIVTIGGKRYLDGGATDSIPVDAFMRMGYERNVVILTQHADYRKSAEMGFLPGIIYRKYPAFAKALKKRHIRYNQTLDRIRQLEKEQKVFVIRPHAPLDIGRMEKDPARVEQAYLMGVEDTVSQKEALIHWLSAGK